MKRTNDRLKIDNVRVFSSAKRFFRLGLYCVHVLRKKENNVKIINVIIYNIMLYNKNYVKLS